MNIHKPIYDSGGIALYCADARTILGDLPKFDLLIADPPYGIEYVSHARNDKFDEMAGDYSDEIGKQILKEAIPRLKNNRHFYVFGKMDFSQMPVSEPVELIWDKGSPSRGNLSTTYGIAHEYIQFGTFVPSKANRNRGDGRLAARLRRGSVLRHSRINGRGVNNHPAEKPVPLLRELIESSSLFGETILDPCCGSGSALVAAKLEGRKAVGIEIEDRYCQLALERIEKA